MFASLCVCIYSRLNLLQPSRVESQNSAELSSSDLVKNPLSSFSLLLTVSYLLFCNYHIFFSSHDKQSLGKCVYWDHGSYMSGARNSHKMWWGCRVSCYISVFYIFQHTNKTFQYPVWNIMYVPCMLDVSRSLKYFTVLYSHQLGRNITFATLDVISFSLQPLSSVHARKNAKGAALHLRSLDNNIGRVLVVSSIWAF